ncbi:hypothetical protein K435DRAFT_706161 [Dendrothele bispora CBS 962.96]|uniref:Myb/SANT-like domain-containing protein n=1 Tax=Dendrothele bispora (strain CBS 962.96) TaxID=1314807 RepID=A0A4S8KK84_DENBC|nr:hypothetical protein K435DRAFT_706161 [Dendrothele bispora CBS 962.96]
MLSKFKAEFRVVSTLRTLSGFGWDDTRKMVIATDEVWDAYLVVLSIPSLLIVY